MKYTSKYVHKNIKLIGRRNIVENNQHCRERHFGNFISCNGCF